MIRTSVLSLIICMSISTVGVFAGPEKAKLTVAAAANLTSVAADLMAAFSSAHPDIDLDFVFGSSGALTTQIQNGAPFQVFMAADSSFPDRIVKAGLAAGDWKIYARGKLVLLSVRPRDFSSGLSLLTKAEVERFAIANPETAPYGKASVQALQKAGLWEVVKMKAVTAQNIAQAVQYTLTAADLGFVNKSALYTTDLAAYTDKEGMNWIEVDDRTYEPLDQAFVVLKPAGTDPAAAAFAAFLASASAKQIFLAAGYAVP